MSRNSTFRRVTKPLPADFYARHTVEVARDLLGCYLEVLTPKGVVHTRIVEVEAYRGDENEDPASHSAAGRTARTELMFGPPGVAYVYFIYGMYDMLNIVTESEGVPGAVLIRGLEPLDSGWDPKDFAGPGRLTRNLGIRRSTHNGLSLQGPELKVAQGPRVPTPLVRTSARIGISKATELDWRFWIDGSPGVSQHKLNSQPEPIR
jgi:DNA-3-methyladenine glycosylase